MRPKLYFERKFLTLFKKLRTIPDTSSVQLAMDNFSLTLPASPFKFWHVFGYEGSLQDLNFEKYLPKQEVDLNGTLIARPEPQLKLYFAINNHFSILQINEYIYRWHLQDCILPFFTIFP
jgi:hypothetical protein